MVAPLVQTEFKKRLVECLLSLSKTVERVDLGNRNVNLKTQFDRQMFAYQEMWRLETMSRVYVDSLVKLFPGINGDTIKLLSLNKMRGVVTVETKDKFPSVDADLDLARLY